MAEKSRRLVGIPALIKKIHKSDSHEIVLLVGAAAAGKSTLSASFEANKFTRFNLDSIRKELYGDESKMGDVKVVNGLFMERLIACLTGGGNVVIDNTNTHSARRKPILEQAVKFGYKVTLLVIDTPLEECLRRNAARDRKVPEVAIRTMVKDLHGEHWPRPEEGTLLVLEPGKTANDFYLCKRQTPA